MIKSTIFTTLLAMGVLGIYGCSHLNGPDQPHSSTSPCFQLVHKINTNHDRQTEYHRPPNTIVDRVRHTQDYYRYKCNEKVTDDPLQKIIQQKQR